MRTIPSSILHSVRHTQAQDSADVLNCSEKPLSYYNELAASGVRVSNQPLSEQPPLLFWPFRQTFHTSEVTQAWDLQWSIGLMGKLPVALFYITGRKASWGQESVSPRIWLAMANESSPASPAAPPEVAPIQSSMVGSATPSQVVVLRHESVSAASNGRGSNHRQHTDH